MKRFMQFFFALPIAAAMLCSCNNDAIEEKAVVSIDGLQDSYEFEAIPDNSVTFTITSNVNWSTQLKGLDWVKVEPGRGLASASAQTVTITPIANEDDQVREGVLTIVAGDVKKEVTLTQKAVSVDPELKFVEGVEEDGVFYIDSQNIFGASLKLYSNRDWTADASDMDEWAVVGPLVGNRGRYATIAITPIEANDGDNRYGSIIFSYGGVTKTLTVCHRKFAAEISVLKGDLPATDISVLSIGDAFELTVDANAAWTVSSSSYWVRPSVDAGDYGLSTLTVEIEPNETGQTRTAVLKFVNRDQEVVINISQGNEFISVSEESLTVSKEGGNLSVSVSSSEKWTAVCSDTWLSVTPASATGNADVTINVAAATSDDPRMATVTFRSDDIPEIYKVVTVTQSAKYIDLNVPLLFNSSNQALNMAMNPDYASSGQTGAVSGKGTGRVLSYTYPDNDLIYAQVVSPNDYGMLFIMAKEGNITFKKIWTDDAIEFHFPVSILEKGRTLCFDYGFMGTTYSPQYWNSEISLDGGATWESFVTGTNTTSPAPVSASANTKRTDSSNKETSYKATYLIPKTVEKIEVIARIRCVDGSARTSTSTGHTSPHNSGTVRIIGADHAYQADANKDEIKGPKFYLK